MYMYISTFFVWFRPSAAPSLTAGILDTRHTTVAAKKSKIKRREPEELEAEREETDDEVTGGGGSSSVFESSSSSYATRTYGGKGGVSSPDIFPEAVVSFPFGSSGFLAGFPFGGWLDGGGGAEAFSKTQHPASPPSFFGAMATVFQGMYEFAREMERLEKGEEKQRRAAEREIRETETAPAARDEDE